MKKWIGQILNTSMLSILKSVKQGDILSFFFLVLFFLGMVWWGWRGTPGKWVEIRVENRLYRYSLDEERIVEWHSSYGKGKVEIRHGQVRMLESSCRDKVCIHKGWVSRSGDAIVCLPCHVMILIKGEEFAIDGITE